MFTDGLSHPQVVSTRNTVPQHTQFNEQQITNFYKLKLTYCNKLHLRFEAN